MTLIMTAEGEAYELFLPIIGAAWINANDRRSWMVRRRLTQQWRHFANVRARAARIPHLDRAKIIAELRFADSRRRDPANWAPTAKACVDGLVDAGVFDDDDHTRVIGPDMRMGPKVIGANAGLRLLIYPLQEGS